MEIEIQGIPQSLRPSYQARIKASKADLTRYKKLSKDVHAQLSRAELLARPGIGSGGDATSDEPYGASDRTRLLAGTALLEDGSRRLLESQRIALETEEQGADILRSLRGQREQIQNSRDTVRVLLLCCMRYMLLHFPSNACHELCADMTATVTCMPATAPLAATRRYLHRPCVGHAQEDDQTVRPPLRSFGWKEGSDSLNLFPFHRVCMDL